MIKRGVSLYSYQQAQYFGKLDRKGMIAEVHDQLKTDGIEIIMDSFVPHYPFPSDAFLYDFRSTMARYEMQAVTADVFLDVHQFRDHVMTHAEAAERLKYDIVIAAKMGFSNVRALSSVPIEVIEMALPTAEKYNVRIGKEIHYPIPIQKTEPKKRKYGMAAMRDFRLTEQIINLRDRTGSPYVGLVPDFGIFQFRPSPIAIAYERRNAKDPEAVDFILENAPKYSFDDLVELTWEKFPDAEVSMMSLERLSLHEALSSAEDLRPIIPYIISIHGKFYEMTQIEGQPGCYEDVCIDYENPIRVLNECGYDGYIDSEYEGQRDQQDRGTAYLPDEVEQVRRHHEMLARLIGE